MISRAHSNNGQVFSTSVSVSDISREQTRFQNDVIAENENDFITKTKQKNSFYPGSSDAKRGKHVTHLDIFDPSSQIRQSRAKGFLVLTYVLLIMFGIGSMIEMAIKQNGLPFNRVGYERFSHNFSKVMMLWAASHFQYFIMYPFVKLRSWFVDADIDRQIYVNRIFYCIAGAYIAFAYVGVALVARLRYELFVWPIVFVLSTQMIQAMKALSYVDYWLVGYLHASFAMRTAQLASSNDSTISAESIGASENTETSTTSTLSSKDITHNKSCMNRKATNAQNKNGVAHKVPLQDDELEAPLRRVAAHLSFYDLYEFQWCPTLVFGKGLCDRKATFRPMYFAAKAVMLLTSIHSLFIITYGSVMPTLESDEHPIVKVIQLMKVCILISLLLFHIMFECILNLLAEGTGYIEREKFYGQFWNCTSWDEFMRDWNTAVHKFFYNHVYLPIVWALYEKRERLIAEKTESANKTQTSSTKTTKTKTYYMLEQFVKLGDPNHMRPRTPVLRSSIRTRAMLLTTLVSAIMHEVFIVAATGLLSGYLGGFQLLQIPLVMLNPLHKGRLYGNAYYWFGLIIGIPGIMYCHTIWSLTVF